MKTAKTLELLAALGQLQFRPMTANDRAAFCEADDDAQICDTGTEALVAPAGALLGETIDRDALLVIASGSRIELHGVNTEEELLCLALDLDRLI